MFLKLSHNNKITGQKNSQRIVRFEAKKKVLTFGDESPAKGVMNKAIYYIKSN